MASVLDRIGQHLSVPLVRATFSISLPLCQLERLSCVIFASASRRSRSDDRFSDPLRRPRRV